MKPFCLVAAILICFPRLASAAIPEQVINSCLKTESTRDVRYIDLAPAMFASEEDEDTKRNTVTITHGRHTYGIWESTNSDEFGLVYNSASLPAAKMQRVGSEAPAPFDPYTAQWGEARHGKQTYLCITFNFQGLGQSGSFQNIRGTYAIDPRMPPKFYYAVGDIRTIKH
jgi:hypothetical protein